MKPIVRVSFIPFVLLSCVCKNETSSNGSSSNDPKMFNVSGKIEKTGAYCGGAKPTQEIIEQLQTPKPVANTTFYIRNDSVNDIDKPVYLEFTTDSLGNFSIQLPKGKYSIVNAEKKNAVYSDELKKKYQKETENYGKIDLECIREWLKTPDGVLNIAGDVKNFSIIYSGHCPWYIPCVSYKGPYPP